MYTNGKGFLSVLWEFLFVKHSETKPEHALPVIKTDLKALKSDEDQIVWLGHSSWFMQLDGNKILIDPVFSSYAAPFSFMNKAFPALILVDGGYARDRLSDYFSRSLGSSGLPDADGA